KNFKIPKYGGQPRELSLSSPNSKQKLPLISNLPLNSHPENGSSSSRSPRTGVRTDGSPAYLPSIVTVRIRRYSCRQTTERITPATRDKPPHPLQTQETLDSAQVSTPRSA